MPTSRQPHLWPSRPELALDTTAHAMTYVRSTERSIPRETGSVNVLITINALDHVSHFGPMCGELLRIMAPGARRVTRVDWRHR